MKKDVSVFEKISILMRKHRNCVTYRDGTNHPFTTLVVPCTECNIVHIFPQTTTFIVVRFL
jgi:hypothetical protein